MVILRLARKAVISRPEVAAASKGGGLALINKLASLMRRNTMRNSVHARKRSLRSRRRAGSGEARADADEKEEGGLNVPGLRDGVSRLRPHFYWPWRGP